MLSTSLQLISISLSSCSGLEVMLVDIVQVPLMILVFYLVLIIFTTYLSAWALMQIDMLRANLF